MQQKVIFCNKWNLLKAYWLIAIPFTFQNQNLVTAFANSANTKINTYTNNAKHSGGLGIATTAFHTKKLNPRSQYPLYHLIHRGGSDLALPSSPSSISEFTENSSIGSNTSNNNESLHSDLEKSKKKTFILANDESFIKSNPDKRQYCAIQLENGLEALLISDPNTDVEAGAVHVKAGHFNDPETRPGLAHFHEHMLFLGTTKYPDENDFETYLSKNGGSTNAFTSMEDTNYYFSVAPMNYDEDVKDGNEINGSLDLEDETKDSSDTNKTSNALTGAMNRFSQFFISPNFREESAERELRAIDSEYLNGIPSDSWRNFQLLKSSGNPAHPFSKFGCGNYNTLTNGGDIKDHLQKNLVVHLLVTIYFNSGTNTIMPAT